jgi:hypothetical protein
LPQLEPIGSQLPSVLTDRGAVACRSIRAKLLSIRLNCGSLLLQAVHDGRCRCRRIRRLLAGKRHSRHSEHPRREPGR